VKPVTLAHALLGILAAAGPARAETWAKQITPGKTADNLFSFAIKSERQTGDRTGEYLEFQVTVTPKPGAGAGDRTGTVEVFAGTEFVSSCEVRPAETAGKLSFSFRVAPKYAERSRFTFAESFRPGGTISYWFVLGDFAEPKALRKPVAEYAGAAARTERIPVGRRAEAAVIACTGRSGTR
jgi:hypothetical protein